MDDAKAYSIDNCCIQEKNQQTAEYHCWESLPSYLYGISQQAIWQRFPTNTLMESQCLSFLASIRTKICNKVELKRITPQINQSMKQSREFCSKMFYSKKIPDTKINICKKKHKDITFVNAYGPHRGRLTETRAELDELYTQLRTIATCLVRSGHILIAGDFNAKVCRADGFNCLGTQSRGYKENKGLNLPQPSATNSLSLRNTAFQHKSKVIYDLRINEIRWREDDQNLKRNWLHHVFNED